MAKVFKKFKNTITASFQDKTVRKSLKKRENKNYHFVLFQHDAEEIVQKKKGKKIQKI